jgi:mono/diheme cytochrome c family protein
VADPQNATQVALGQTVYVRACAACHGANLEGEPNWKRPLPTGSYPAPPHDATGHTWHHPDTLLFNITKYGGQATAPPGFRSQMPPFKDLLSDEEIWAVLAFIKSRWPPAVQARQAQVNAQQRNTAR